jgi:hypothetical protein
MAGNKVVAHYRDGRILKGWTADFLATKDHFHLSVEDAAPAAKPSLVALSELKAVFFVKDFRGNPAHGRSNEFLAIKPIAGRKIRVVFQDGEELVGTTQGYAPGRPGFFLVPADPDSNTDRCFVVMASTREVGFL